MLMEKLNRNKVLLTQLLEKKERLESQILILEKKIKNQEHALLNSKEKSESSSEERNAETENKSL